MYPQHLSNRILAVPVSGGAGKNKYDDKGMDRCVSIPVCLTKTEHVRMTLNAESRKKGDLS